MQVLCLVGNNGRRTEKRKKAKFHGGLSGEVEARKVVLCGGHGIVIANNKKQSEWQHVAAAVNSVARSAQSQN